MLGSGEIKDFYEKNFIHYTNRDGAVHFGTRFI